MEKIKKPFSLKKTIVIAAISLVVAAALIVGNVFANIYENLLTVWFGGGAIEATEEEKELCEQIEAEGIVLLKNEDGALPLSDTEKKLALLGQDSVDFVYGGAGSGSVDASLAPTMKEAMEASGFTVNQTLWDFYETGAGSSYRKTFPNASGDGDFAVNEVPQSVYTSDVKSSLDGDDVGIVVIGRSGGESADLPTAPLASGYLYLEPDKDELDLLALACEKFEKVVLIVNANTPVELGILEDPAYANVKAALWVGAVGQEGMYAIGDVLNGSVNPSGRLVDTYAYDSLSAPSNYNLGDFTIANSSVRNGTKYIVYQEGIYVGYRYYETRYADAVLGQGNAGDYDYAAEVQFPFGYGLSYSEFSWSGFSMEENADGDFEISLTVTNEGPLAGKEVVQIYMSSPYTQYDKENGIEKAAVELVGYTKVEVPANGRVENVTVTVDKTELRTYDANGAGTYILDKGNYYFALGNGSHEALNNILAKKADIADNSNGAVNKERMTSAGNAGLVEQYTVAEQDNEIFATSVTGEEITNQFDSADLNRRDEDASNDIVYLSRSNWAGTMPKATFAAKAYTAAFNSLSANDEMVAELSNTYKSSSGGTMPTMGAKNDLKLIQFRGVEMNESIEWNGKTYTWDDLLDQLTFAEMARLIGQGYHNTAYISSVSKPETKDENGPAGITTSLTGGSAQGTCYPSADLRAATFNDELVKEMGVMLGNDALWSSPKVYSGLYGPGGNIQRTPYGGRNFEYYSEDPFIGGNICANEVEGIQSKGMFVYLKHFALNDQESGRDGISVWANEQAIREIYLQQFETSIVKGGAHCVMSSFNRVGATWSGANKNLMTNVLRGEWGMDGQAVTDYSGNDFMDVALGLLAGQDIWDYSGTKWTNKLNTLKNDANIVNAMRQASARILYTVANSNAMNGYTVDTDVTGTLAWWQSALIAADVIFGVLTVAAATMLVFTIVKNKKQPEVADN